MLSLAAHLCVLLLFVLWLSQPKEVPLPEFIVIELGTPAPSEQVSEAAANEEAAPTAPLPRVAEQQSGEPQARSAEQVESVAPEPEEVTRQPQPAPPQPAPPQVAEEESRARPSVAATPTPAPAEEVAQSDEPPVAPVPQVRAPAPQPATDLPVATAATVLPEIDEVDLEPRPAEQAIRIPQPAATVEVPEALTVAVTPSVRVAAPEEIPSPDATANVAPPRAIPAPNASAQVAAAQAVPMPGARAEVAQAVPVPQPGATAQVAAAVPVPRPQATASVAAPTALPTPQVSASVAAAAPVPLLGVEAEVAQATTIPTPGAQAQVPTARPVTVAAQVVVDRPRDIPAPTVSAQVTAPLPALGAAMAGAAPAGAAQNPSNRIDERQAGGNSDRPAQVNPDEGALAGNLGRAAVAAPGAGDGATALRPEVPFRDSRLRPLAVLLDNFRGYPQAGLAEATAIAEMPVEGGLTRLMAIYDQVDPERVGPIRSARDYFVDLARRFDGILVHDGGSPAALAAIDRGRLPTLNAYRFGELFSRGQGREAPYNLYSSGNSLRDAINRLSLGQSLEMRGVVPRPPEEAPEAEAVEVSFGANYSSGFAYIRELDIYRWVRNGDPAVDASGRPVFVDAVLLARIDARPIPDDPAGRLYIPLRGGEATLYLRGKAIPGRWQPAPQEGEGILFVSDDGEQMDLAPFRTWMLFAPGFAQVASR